MASKRRKRTPTTSVSTFWVVSETYHYDCYKRPETKTRIVGTYADKERAYEKACRGQVAGILEHRSEEDAENDTEMVKELMNMIRACTSYEECWTIVSSIENPFGESEFTGQASGDYYSIETQTVELGGPQTPIQTYLTELQEI